MKMLEFRVKSLKYILYEIKLNIRMRYFFCFNTMLDEKPLIVLKAIVKCGQNKNKIFIVYGKKQNQHCKKSNQRTNR